MDAKRLVRRESRVSLSLIAFAAPALYVLSYAPFLRLEMGADIDYSRFPDGVMFCFGEEYFIHTHPAYAPVEWMIDHTPLRKPLIVWANVWTVHDRCEGDSVARVIDTLPTDERKSGWWGLSAAWPRR